MNSLLDQILATGTSIESEEGKVETPNTEVIPNTEEAQKNTSGLQDIDLSQHFGDEYKGKNIEEVADGYKALKSKQEEFERLYNESKEKGLEYGSETSALYDSWIKGGGNEDFRIFSIVKNFDKDKIEDIDALVAKEVLENPNYVGFEEMLKEKLIERYQIEATEYNELTDKQVEFNKARLAHDASKAKEYLLSEREKLQVKQAPTKGLTEEQLAKRKSDWELATSNVFTNAKSISIPIAVTEDGKTSFNNYINFQVPENVITKLQKDFTDAYSSFSDANDDIVGQMKGQVYQRIIAENLPYIIKSAIDKKEAELIEEYDKKYSGGVLKSQGGSSRQLGGELSEGDKHILGLFNR